MGAAHMGLAPTRAVSKISSAVGVVDLLMFLENLVEVGAAFVYLTKLTNKRV